MKEQIEAKIAALEADLKETDARRDQHVTHANALAQRGQQLRGGIFALQEVLKAEDKKEPA
jgi:hypothetical protein